MKIITVVGARPQFVKLPLLSRALRDQHREVIVHTGQHYDAELSQNFFNDLALPEPDYNLGVGSGTHGYQTGEMIKRIERVLIDEKPDIVLVFGDTNSTLAAALAASKLCIRIAHVEAGMRNYDRKKPEEINRIITDHISDILFAPTQTAVDNLAREGLSNNVYLTGDVGYDVFLRMKTIAEDRSDVLRKYNLKSKGYVTLTLHKQQNTDSPERLETIISALRSLSTIIAFPIHPRTHKSLESIEMSADKIGNNFVVLPPLGFFDFIKLVNHSWRVITDSGGVQKEAYSLRVPCITLRETEWIETVREGWNQIVEIEKVQIINAVLNSHAPDSQREFLGNGEAFRSICDIISSLGDEIP